ncbi:MAG TPA: CAP domain-containing protein [Nocardioides sp.]|nr:CAP domain-containing protein [Nocardioides sp.]
MNRGIQNVVIGALVVAAAIAAPIGAGSGGTAAAATPATTVVVRTALVSSLNTTLEGAIVTLTNARRALVGCRPLRVDLDLRQAARGHSRRMAKAQVMSHQLPGEYRLGRRVTNAGYVGWTRVAENIAAGFSSASSVVRAWWNSPTHKRNLTDCSLRHIGVGVVWNGLRFYWTQDFGRR